MQERLQRYILLSLLSLGAAVLLISCAPQKAPVQRANGLVCQTHSSSTFAGLNATTETDCTFKCPDGRLLSLPVAVSSQSKDQLNFLFCGVALPAPAPTPAGSSAGADAVPAAALPLLNQQVDICDPLKGIMNFVLAQPPQDLSGKKLVVQIQGQEVPCSILPNLPGELSCKLPASISFPAGIIVRVNDQVVNMFPYGGGNCEGRSAYHPASEQFAGSQPPPTEPPPAPGPNPNPGPHPGHGGSGGDGGNGHPPKPPHGHGKGPKGILLVVSI
jgi:hypothetical protein